MIIQTSLPPIPVLRVYTGGQLAAAIADASQGITVLVIFWNFMISS
ncbi:hypothetical protein [Azospirillum largimobile]